MGILHQVLSNEILGLLHSKSAYKTISISVVLTEILNIERIKVISQRQHEGIGIILQIEPIEKESVCPRCGTKSHRVHQNYRYIVTGKMVVRSEKIFSEQPEHYYPLAG
jgi:hypothetical protein